MAKKPWKFPVMMITAKDAFDDMRLGLRWALLKVILRGNQPISIPAIPFIVQRPPISALRIQRKVVRMSMARPAFVTIHDMLDNTPNGGAEYQSAVRGEPVTYEELTEQCKGIIHLVRACWVRDGYTSTGVFDTFWDVQFEVKNKETGRPGLPREEFEKSIQDYYGLRGWIKGVPTRATLEKYDLRDVADDLEKRGLLQG